jgi:hypothetical protein
VDASGEFGFATLLLRNDYTPPLSTADATSG